MSQGASQGVEDAAALTEILDRIKSADQIPSAMHQFEKFRKPRAEALVKFSRERGQFSTMVDGPEQELRDMQMQVYMKAVKTGLDYTNLVPDQNAEVNSPQYAKWMNEYDVLGEVRTDDLHTCHVPGYLVTGC